MQSTSWSAGRAPLVLTLLSLVIPGCGADGPGAGELREALALQLPNYLQAASLDLEARQNTGSETELAWTSSFKAELKLTEDMYQEARREEGVLFVRRVAAAGEAFTVSGKVLVAPTGSSWQSSVFLDDDPTGSLGQPLSEFRAARVIVVGSREHAAYSEERLAAVLSAGRFDGHATGAGGVRFPIAIHFNSYHAPTRSVQGSVQWPSLGGVSKKFEGEVVGRTIVAKETAWIDRGDGYALFPIEYRIELDNTLSAVTGSWQASGYNGRLSLNQR